MRLRKQTPARSDVLLYSSVVVDPREHIQYDIVCQLGIRVLEIDPVRPYLLSRVARCNIGVTTSSTIDRPARACSDAANLQTEAQRLLSIWVKSADMIGEPNRIWQPVWLRNFVNGIGWSVGNFHKDIQGIESTSCIQKTTWPCNCVPDFDIGSQAFIKAQFFCMTGPLKKPAEKFLGPYEILV